MLPPRHKDCKRKCISLIPEERRVVIYQDLWGKGKNDTNRISFTTGTKTTKIENQETK